MLQKQSYLLSKMSRYLGWSVHMEKFSSSVTEVSVAKTEISVTARLHIWTHWKTFTKENVSWRDFGNRDSPADRANMKKPWICCVWECSLALPSLQRVMTRHHPLKNFVPLVKVAVYILLRNLARSFCYFGFRCTNLRELRQDLRYRSFQCLSGFSSRSGLSKYVCNSVSVDFVVFLFTAASS